MQTKLLLKERIEGCLVGAAIGAELGWTWHVHTEKYRRVARAEDLLNLKLEPVSPREEKAYFALRPYAQHSRYPRLTPLIDIGARAYVDKQGRAAMLAGALRGAGNVPKEWIEMFKPEVLIRIKNHAQKMSRLISHQKLERLQKRQNVAA